MKYEIITKREQVYYNRRRSAVELASMKHENPTDDDIAAAYSLLERVIRYALADAREFEIDNDGETYRNAYRQAQHEHREKLLSARRERLQEELDTYGVRMKNYGLYPSIVDHTGRDYYMLHYFN